MFVPSGGSLTNHEEPFTSSIGEGVKSWGGRGGGGVAEREAV